jgi:COP9 signalosome complex subunit 6
LTSFQKNSVLATHLEAVQNAIQMLNFRVKSIQRFLEATLQGQVWTLFFLFCFFSHVSRSQVKKDHNLLRQISALANMLPAIDSEVFRKEYLTEFNDTLLVTYLSAVTKGLIKEEKDKKMW